MPLTKTHTLRFRAVNRDTFNFIKNGKKKVETRAQTVKYKNLKAGDTIFFVCGKNKFKREIKKAFRFKSVSAMLKKFSPCDINPKVKTKSELIETYNSFPGYKQKLKKFGIIAILFK